MKVQIGCVVSALLMGVSVASLAVENCPEISSIEQVGPGVYRAPGEGGEWSGVLQGVVAKTAAVQSFEVALTIQDHEMAPQEFQYCSYSVGVRTTLDMRFLAKNEKEYTVKTVGDAWKKEAGPFGLIYNVCENTAPENCTFSLVQ